jgi:hypothetical protein
MQHIKEREGEEMDGANTVPVYISYRQHPAAHMSIPKSYGSPNTVHA